MTISKFRRKPGSTAVWGHVEAMQVVDGMSNVIRVMDWIVGNGGVVFEPFLPSWDNVLTVRSPIGDLVAALGDWVFTADGQFGVAKAHIFEADYEPVGGVE